jgi:osmotically-inducible protein OsmY
MRTDITGTNHRLAVRVCAELLLRVEHVKGIQVFADNWKVTLKGFALREELDDVIAAVRQVKGIRSVINKLDLRDAPGNVLALQS